MSGKRVKRTRRDVAGGDRGIKEGVNQERWSAESLTGAVEGGGWGGKRIKRTRRSLATGGRDMDGVKQERWSAERPKLGCVRAALRDRNGVKRKVRSTGLAVDGAVGVHG